FAIAAHTASWVAAVLMRRGSVERPRLGVAARGIELSLVEAARAEQARAVDDLKRALVLGEGQTVALELQGAGGSRSLEVWPDPARPRAA
ncbi:MAG TPA: hypothetical protein VIW29_14550, partial [Polyangiaceae bacterium]